MPRTAPRQLESIASAAAYADVTTRTIYNWIADGRLRAYRAGPKLLRIDRADLERVIRPGLRTITELLRAKAAEMDEEDRQLATAADPVMWARAHRPRRLIDRLLGRR